MQISTWSCDHLTNKLVLGVHMVCHMTSSRYKYSPFHERQHYTSVTMDEDKEIANGELHLILEDETEDNNPVSSEEDTYFPYEDTQILTFNKTTQTDTYDWIEEGSDPLSACLKELIELLEWSNVDYFVIEQLSGESLIQIVLHAGAVILTDSGFKQVSETQEYKHVMERIEDLSPGKPGCTSIENRTQFRSYLQGLFSNVSLMYAGIPFLWPFHGWTQ